MRLIMTLLGCFALTSLATGCSHSAEWCDVECDCRDCNDIEYDECLISRDAEEDKADIYGCSEQFDAYHECVMLNNECALDLFGPEAECLVDENVDLAQCIDSNSALR